MDWGHYFSRGLFIHCIIFMGGVSMDFLSMDFGRMADFSCGHGPWIFVHGQGVRHRLLVLGGLRCFAHGVVCSVSRLAWREWVFAGCNLCEKRDGICMRGGMALQQGRDAPHSSGYQLGA